MQLHSRQVTCSTCSRPQRVQLRIVANFSNNGYVPPSPSSLDQPSWGGTPSFDLPGSSDVPYSKRGLSSDILRPSDGANGNVVFVTASIERPGGRGGRSDMPSGSDAPAPQDPALLRPGGRGGRDLGLEGGNQGVGAPKDPALGRPGGRGGRDLGLEGSDQGVGAPKDPALGRPGGRGGRNQDLASSGPSGPVTPASLERPGGRGGRESVGGGDDSGGSSGGSGGDGSSGGSGGDSSSGGSSGDNSAFSPGQGFVGVVLYAGVLAAAWAAHKAFFVKPAPAVEAPKPRTVGKGKKKK